MNWISVSKPKSNHHWNFRNRWVCCDLRIIQGLSLPAGQIKAFTLYATQYTVIWNLGEELHFSFILIFLEFLGAVHKSAFHRFHAQSANAPLVDQASTYVGLAQSANTPLVVQASTTVGFAQSANTPLVDQASTTVGLAQSANTPLLTKRPPLSA